MSADDLRLDLEELQRLEGLAKRPRVLSLLANEIRSVDAKVAIFWFPPRALSDDRFPSVYEWIRICCVLMFVLFIDSWPKRLRRHWRRRRSRRLRHLRLRRRPLPV